MGSTQIDYNTMLYLVKRSLCPQILAEICHGITLHLQHAGVVYAAGGRIGEHACGVIHEVGRKGAVLNLGILQIPGQLMDDGAHHLQMPQLFCTGRGVRMTPLRIRLWRGGITMGKQRPLKLRSPENLPSPGGEEAEGFYRYLIRCLLLALQEDEG